LNKYFKLKKKNTLLLEDIIYMFDCFEGESENKMIQIIYKKVLILELKNLLQIQRKETSQISSIRDKLSKCATETEKYQIDELIKNTIIGNRIIFLKDSMTSIIPYLTLVLSVLKHTELPTKTTINVTKRVNNIFSKTLGNISNYISGERVNNSINTFEEQQDVEKTTKVTISLINKTKQMILNTTYVRTIINILTDPLGSINSENFTKIEQLAHLLHYIVFCIILITASGHENFLNDVFENVRKGYGLDNILKIGGKSQKKKKTSRTQKKNTFHTFVKEIIS